RLHSSIGYVTPYAKLMGMEEEIFAERDRKLEAAREERKRRRQRAGVKKILDRPVMCISSAKVEEFAPIFKLHFRHSTISCFQFS
ncbi:MAG: hypothetical protein JW801_18090, partial [Bacteroidales bacterium]|nr:hypothetical protein [Bacteroidales bacterium]